MKKLSKKALLSLVLLLITACVAPAVESRVADTVGAGDAFSSILLVGHYYDWPLHLILERAQEFASAIVGIQGATINDASFYQPFIDEWQLIP